MVKKIMIVDDDEDIRTTVKTVLEKNKYKVITAINADDCLKKIKGGGKTRSNFNGYYDARHTCKRNNP